MEIGNQIKILRLRRGITQEEMAQHFGISPKPWYVDPFESMAQIYEIQGNFTAAIGIREEQLAVLAEEWKITQGEGADEVYREIDRLKKRSEKAK